MKKKTILLLLIILIMQSLFFLYMGVFKLGYHMDEIYSYGLANSYDYQWAVIDEGREYHPYEIFSDYVDVNDEHKFDYTIDWRNQAMDVHPPTYYVLLHTISIIFNSDFSKWPGIALNTIVAVFMSLGVFFLSRKYTENEDKALLITIINAFALGTCNNVMYIRMYTLLTVWTVWFVYLIYSTMKDGRKLDRKFSISYISLLTLGVMTQYYFMIFAFFVCAVLAVIFLREKRFIELRRLVMYSAISGILCVVIFPYILKHLVGGKRGRASFYALFELKAWFEDIKTMAGIIAKQIYINKYITICLILMIVAIFVIYYLKKGVFPNGYMYIFMIASALFFLMISKIAPFATDRYIFCIYPIIIISTYGFIIKYGDILLGDGCVKQTLLSLIIITIIVSNYFVNHIPYLFSQNQIMWDYTYEYKNVPCLYIYDYEACDVYWDFPQIREYDSLRFVRVENINNLEFMDMNQYDEVVIYIIKTLDKEEILDDVLSQNQGLDSYKLLYSSGGANVYYCK